MDHQRSGVFLSPSETKKSGVRSETPVYFQCGRGQQCRPRTQNLISVCGIVLAKFTLLSCKIHVPVIADGLDFARYSLEESRNL